MKLPIYRILVIVILALAAVLIAGTVYGLVRSPDAAPLFRIGEQGVQNEPGLGSGELNVFSGLGRLRIPVDGQPPLTIVLSVSFTYPANDRPFTEELASRIGELRSITVDYFASLPRHTLANLDEGAAKEEILKRYNALLRLGNIEALYFGDLMIVE